MYEIDKVKFGEFISERRKEKGITQKELASRLYISDKAISKWETGHSVPDITLLVPLAELLGVTVTELLECQRIEAVDKLDVAQTDNLVKKVISLSEEEAMGRPRINKRNVLIYLGSLLVSVIEIVVIYQLQKNLDFVSVSAFLTAGMAMLFGIYFWFFMREKLPAYYDENHISVYVDGVVHMNMMGVYFNNHNWPHILKVLRMWSVFGMTIFPVADVICSIACGEKGAYFNVIVTLALVLGGLFIPVYYVGNKYQCGTGEELQKQKKER